MGDIQGDLKDMLSKGRREAPGTVSVPVSFCGGGGGVAPSPTAARNTVFGDQVVFSNLCLCILIHCLPYASCFFGNAVKGIIEMK